MKINMQHTYFNTKIRAFTLIELMVTIAIFVIVVSFAIPSFTSMIQNNYSLSISHDLISSLKFARSEAIKRNSPVSLCATSDSNYTSCGNAWSLGWIIFSDYNGDGTYSSGNDVILRINMLSGSNAQITPSNNTYSFTYNNVGFPASNASNITIDVYATGCKADNRRTISINMTGAISASANNCP